MPYTYSIRTQYNITVDNDHNTATLRVDQHDSIDEATATDPKLLVAYVRELARKYKQSSLESLRIERFRNFSVIQYNEDDGEESLITDYTLWFNQAQKRSKTREVVLAKLGHGGTFVKWFEETKSLDTLEKDSSPF